jgi:hypothetical protein
VLVLQQLLLPVPPTLPLLLPPLLPPLPRSALFATYPLTPLPRFPALRIRSWMPFV